MAITKDPKRIKPMCICGVRHTQPDLKEMHERNPEMFRNGGLVYPVRKKRDEHWR